MGILKIEYWNQFNAEMGIQEPALFWGMVLIGLVLFLLALRFCSSGSGGTYEDGYNDGYKAAQKEQKKGGRQR